MRSLVTAIIAAIEAVAVALAGLAIVAIPATLVWVITFGLAAEPASVAADITGVWLLAHFSPLHFSVSAEAALGLGLAPQALSFTLSLAPLGITLLSVLLALRAGWRFAGRGGVGAMGVIGGAIGFGGVALAAAALTGPLLAWPVSRAALVAAAVYGAASALAFLVRAGRDAHPWWQLSVRRVLQGFEYVGVRSASALPTRAAETLRLAAAALALMFGLAALGFTVAVATGYADVTALTQGLQLDPIGSLTLFLVQLAFVPVAVVWSLAWFAGTGFAIGSGSSVTPFETLLGPVPALPMFGLIPDGWADRGALAPAILVFAALVLGVFFARRPAFRRMSWGAALVIPLLAAALTGLAVAGLSRLAAGSMGPDRLAENGPDAWLTGGVLALEVGGGLLVGVIAGRFDAAKVRASLPEAVPGLDAVRRLRDGVAAAATSDAAATSEAPAPANDRVTVADDDADSEVTADFTTAVDEALELAERAVTEDASAAEETEMVAMVDENDHLSDLDGSDAVEEEDAVVEGSDEATLLRAYAWDAEAPGDPEPEREPGAGRRSGWRWPGRGR